jgi:membrane protease YdiL (CAAX protease family)
MTNNPFLDILRLISFVILGLLCSNLITTIILFNGGYNLEDIRQGSSQILMNLSSNQLMVAQLSSHICGLILPAFLLTKFSPSIKESLSVNSWQASNFLKYILLLLLALPLVSYSAYLNQLIPLPEWMHSNEDKLQDLIKKLLDFKNIGQLILAIVTIGIIPGIGEEWIFRGILQTRFALIFKNQWIALVLASVLFSAIHMQFEGFIPRFILGFILGYIFMHSKNLWYSIILHMLFNSVQVVAAYFLGPDMMDESLSGDKSPMPWYAALFMLSIFIVYFFSLESKRNIHVV